MMKSLERTWAVATVILLAAVTGLHASDPATLVACAPGYPGSTEQAQPTMDEFSAQTTRMAGWNETALAAVYYNDLEEGLARLEQSDVALALVPLPFYLEYADRLSLRPILEAGMAENPEETWTLVSGKGKLAGPGSLDGWEITGRGGYSATFVRNIALEGWGALPATASVTFSSRTVSALRKASRGESIAVLLDGEQTAALNDLPFASDLDRVYESDRLPATLLCVVADRLGVEKIDELTKGLTRMSGKKSGREILDQLRLSGFESIDKDEIERIRELWRQSTGS